MGAMVVVVVLPLLELVVEDVGVVDAVGSLHLAVESGCAGLDVDVADALVEHVPVELRAELRRIEAALEERETVRTRLFTQESLDAQQESQ